MTPSSKRTFVFFVRVPILLLLLLLVVMGTFSKRGVVDWKRMHNQNTELVDKLNRVNSQKAELEKQIHAFETDKNEQERVVRQVLGYIRTNETVIEFD